MIDMSTLLAVHLLTDLPALLAPTTEVNDGQEITTFARGSILEDVIHERCADDIRRAELVIVDEHDTSRQTASRDTNDAVPQVFCLCTVFEREQDIGTIIHAH